MTTAIMPAQPLPVARPAPAGTVFLPKEHGSWSLALEPLALGLLVAPSWAGGALAGAVLAGFFARRPLKAAFSPIQSGRRRLAREVVVMWSVLAAAGMIEAVVLAPWTALWPLLPAAVLGGLFLYFEAQDESRAAAAEVAGSAAFACVPAALATLAGWPALAALVLGALALARSVPAVLTVRCCLRVAKGGAPGRTVPLLAAGAATVGLVALSLAGRAPGIAGWLGGLFFLRSLWLLGPWRPAWPARHIGMMEAGLGICYFVLLAAGWPSP